MKKVYLIGIGGIGMSGLARHFLSHNYEVFGSDKQSSSVITELISEGAKISIGENEDEINGELNIVVYSEAIPERQVQRKKAKTLGIQLLSYAQAVGMITKDFQLISIAGTHGKSTTTSILGIILKESEKNFSTIVGTLVPNFGNKNYYYQEKIKDSQKDTFILESCEYKESFLNYSPRIALITNVEADHLDFFKTEENYIKSFEKFIEKVEENGYVIINMTDSGSKNLQRTRNNVHYVEVYEDSFTFGNETHFFGKINVHVPGNHVLTDAKLAYTAAFLIGISREIILRGIEKYYGTWRRMERIGETDNNNILMSDYGHHPTEILVTTKALKEKFPEKILCCIFQPHQYSRTYELLKSFKKCFTFCDIIIVPNIYASRDTEEDKKRINAEIFLETIENKEKIYGNGLDNTVQIIRKYDGEGKDKYIFLLLGAGDIDGLRTKIKTH